MRYYRRYLNSLDEYTSFGYTSNSGFRNLVSFTPGKEYTALSNYLHTPNNILWEFSRFLNFENGCDFSSLEVNYHISVEDPVCTLTIKYWEF